MSGSPPLVRAAGARLIGSLGDAQGIQHLLSALSDADADVRESAVTAIGNIGPAAADRLLARTHDRRDVEGRSTALRARGRTARGDARTVEVLRDALEDPNAAIRSAAMEALSDIGPAARIAASELFVRLPLSEPFERGLIRSTLSALSPLDASALPALRNELRSGNAARLELAAQLIIAMGPAGRPLAPDLRHALATADGETAALLAEALVAVVPDQRPSPEVIAFLYDSAVASLVREAERRFDRALHCPIPTAAAFGGVDLPPFPWPPPPPSSSDVIPRSFLGDETSTLGAVHAVLDHAVRNAGFAQIPLYAVPGGFAMVTQVERMHEDGRPYPEDDRWTAGKVAPRSLGEYLAQLFLGKPGQFRMIAIALTTQPNVLSGDETLTEDAARALAAGGGRVLPAEIKELPFAEREALVLVYHFERRSGSVSSVVAPTLPPRRHLELAGVWQGLAD